MKGRQWKLSIITATLGDLGDRFCPSYKSPVSFTNTLDMLKTKTGLDGIELVYDTNSEEGDVKTVSDGLADCGLQVSAVNVPLFRDAEWKLGSFSSTEQSTRSKAINNTKRGIDFAKQLDCSIINLWLGQDGMDYPFQYDYSLQWDNLISGLQEVADHASDIKICLESKPREPRNRSLLDSPATTLLAAQDTGRDNVGITIDIGHVFMNQQNAAQALELSAKRGKLFNIHLNDNYGAWDDDMAVGSIRIVEFLELFHCLRNAVYDGWCSIDIFPFREDPAAAAEESIIATLELDALVEKIGPEELERWKKDPNPLAGVTAVRKLLLGT